MEQGLSLVDAVAKIQNNELDPKAYIESLAVKANDLEPTLKAFVRRESVESMLNQITPGLLSGIPIAVKDLFNTHDCITSYGSEIYSQNLPKEDAEVVKRIRRLGGVIFGKSVTTEFAWRKPGPTTNPWNSKHTPGGSSSGSAAAVAAGIVPLGVGTQTVGSIIRPAAFCGVVGFKPTYNAVSNDGVFPFSLSLDHIGFFARKVKDAAFAFEALKDNAAVESINSQSFVSAIKNPSIGFLVTPYDHLMSKEQSDLLKNVAINLEKSGATIKKIVLPDKFWEAINSMYLIMRYEGGRVHQNHYSQYKNLISSHIEDLVIEGGKIEFLQYQQAKALQKQLRNDFNDYFLEFDALMTAPATGEAPKGLESTGDPVFCALWSFLGIPAISIPAGKSINQLPLGIQAVGNFGNDTRLLEVALFIEKALEKSHGK